MMREPEKIDRRKFLAGAAGALAAGMVPEKAAAARHPLDSVREAAEMEAADMEARMQGYRAFMQERSLLIDTTLIMRDVFKPYFVPVFKMLMTEYVMVRLQHEPATVDGLHILAHEGELLSAWMIEEIKRRWEVGDDRIKEERIRSLIHRLSDLARESLQKEKPDER